MLASADFWLFYTIEVRKAFSKCLANFFFMLKAKEYIVEKFICQMKTNAVDLGKITKALKVNLIKLSNFNSTLGSTYLEAKKASLV